MRLFLRQRRPTPGEPGIAGTVRVDPRTKSLTKRLRPGDIAVIDHLDLDRVSAEALAACRPAAVLNAARSTSGRYPNLGPGILLEAGIPLVDDLGPDVLTLEEGRRIRVVDAAVHDGERLVAEGTLQDAASVAAAMEDARAGLATQLEAFAANTMDYLRRERELLLDGVGVPDIATVIDGRQVLIVVRGYHYKEDLVTLRPYIKEYRPVLIGVDGGADAILEAGWKPSIIVGNMDSVSDRALTCGAEVVVLADDKGAELIVAVGTHATLIEFLDKGRSGMASTFLTRLRVGGKLVDAKGVSRLYRQRISNWQLGWLVLAGLLALTIAIASTAAGQTTLGLLGAWLDSVWSSVRQLFGAVA